MRFNVLLIFFQLLLLPFGASSHENKIFITGRITDVITGNPVPVHEVTLKFKHDVPPFLHFDRVMTNESGHFSFVFDSPFSKGILQVSTVDCVNQLITNNLEFNLSQTHVTTSFAICYSQQSNICLSDFLWVKQPEVDNQYIFRQASMGAVESWRWDFGDGKTSVDADPVHTFADDGHFRVCLSVFGNNGNCSSEQCYYIDSNDDTLIVARFTHYPIPGSTNTIQFHDLSLGNVNGWIWDFGDGRASTVQHPRHNYSQPGTYEVCLIALKTGNLRDTLCMSVEAGPLNLCQSDFLVFNDPLDPFTIHLKDISGNEPDSWEWDFGDGSISTGQDTHHTYSGPGVYTVGLTTSDAETNCSDTHYQMLSISNPQQYIAWFEAFQLSGSELTFRFAEQSAGIPDQWHWDFGDGNTSDLENPLHSYAQPGIYQVCLTVMSYDNSVSDTFCTELFAGINADCSASFRYSQDSENSMEYHFGNASTGNAEQFEWDFGDGNISTLENPTHIFAAKGYYRVCLTITDAAGNCSGNYCETILVNDELLQADFIFLPFPQDIYTVQFVNQSSGRYTVRLWDFGDGETSYLTDPQHTFTEPGAYMVCLHLDDQENDLSHQKWMTVEIGNPAECNADFYNFPSVSNPLVIRFVDLSTGEIVLHNWDFGDGNSSTLKNPVHQFNAGGAYNVCLDITDFSGTCTSEMCKEVVIDFEPLCVADFEYDIPAGTSPLTVGFTDLSTGIMNEWIWDFGDGNTSLLANPTHTYADSGLYLVNLAVKHSDSLVWCNSIVSKQVHVFAPPFECFADFSAYPDSGVNKPNLFHFVNKSTGNPDTWEWNFGDGSTSSEANPTHQYQSSGTYPVTLSVAKVNPYGQSCSDSKTMEISSPDYFHIGGFIFAGNFPINNPAPTGDTAEILLYRYRNNNIQPLDTAIFTEYGYYHSLYLLKDHYLIKSQLTGGSSNFRKYFPTYFGNDLTWQQANVCLVADSNHYHLNVNLIEMPEMNTGNGVIGGSVLYFPQKSTEVIPVEKTVVLMLNEQQQPVNFLFTQDNGTFTFENLPLGTYYLVAESAGKVCVPVMVTLTQQNPAVSDLQLDLHDQGATAVNEHPVAHQLRASVFPNPVTDKLYLSLLQPVGSFVEVTISDISGRAFYRNNFQTTEGQNLLEIPASSFQRGLYLLRVVDFKGVRTTETLKFVK